MIDALSIKAVQSVTDAGYPDDAGAVLLVELEGLTEEVEDVTREVESAPWDTGASEVRVAEDPADREKLWVGRKTAFGAFGTIAPNYYLVDWVVPRTRLTQVLRKVAEISQKRRITIANVFHAGDGNLHPCMLFDEREPGVSERAAAAALELMEYCVAQGGPATLRHSQPTGVPPRLGRQQRGQLPELLARGPAAQLQLEQLPGYAPELNPDDGVWRYLKRVELKNVVCASWAPAGRVLGRSGPPVVQARGTARLCQRSRLWLVVYSRISKPPKL